MRPRRPAALAALVALASCSDGGGEPPCQPAEAPLAGTVGGAAWSAVTGAAAPDLVDPAEGVLDLYADAIAISSWCTPLGATSSFVMVRLPASRVAAGMEAPVDVWFCVETGTWAECGSPGTGVLRIDARDGTTMTGALCASKGADHVSGTFTIPDCFP